MTRLGAWCTHRNFVESRKAEVQSAPVPWAEISPVVAPLRVATPCYTTEQRTLLGYRVSTPKGWRHAALRCPEPISVGRLLLRTSENTPFFFMRTPLHRRSYHPRYDAVGYNRTPLLR